MLRTTQKKKGLIRLKKIKPFDFLFFYGAGARNRTETGSPPRDFESRASTSFTTPARFRQIQKITHIVNKTIKIRTNQYPTPQNVYERISYLYSIVLIFKPSQPKAAQIQ